MRSIAFAALLALAVPVAPAAHAQAVDRPQSLPAVPLTITSGGKAYRYRVEVARTGQQQAIGLMFRPAMAADRGMIFPMKPPRVASFWMMNTWIPLDMLFIRADGRISSIAHMTTPYSLDSVASHEPVGAVLELAGGEAKRRGFRPGDRVKW